MKKLMSKLQGKVLLQLVAVVIALGNIVLFSPCPMGVYEPKKPDILKNEK